ncbi:hypothetical protein DM860_004797 [Cuscuta australis]|uniref:Uncharacterized protein n=1 Tax=Cuscuta australis TaxID=267555 RepID=A0A328DPC5_9ASTE|nr:hypothetical protein DM860_004797 [Cuscuta australis]
MHSRFCFELQSLTAGDINSAFLCQIPAIELLHSHRRGHYGGVCWNGIGIGHCLVYLQIQVASETGISVSAGVVLRCAGDSDRRDERRDQGGVSKASSSLSSRCGGEGIVGQRVYGNPYGVFHSVGSRETRRLRSAALP